MLTNKYLWPIVLLSVPAVTTIFVYGLLALGNTQWLPLSVAQAEYIQVSDLNRAFRQNRLETELSRAEDSANQLLDEKAHGDWDAHKQRNLERHQKKEQNIRQQLYPGR